MYIFKDVYCTVQYTLVNVYVHIIKYYIILLSGDDTQPECASCRVVVHLVVKHILVECSSLSDI